jgi:PTS system ascorbate-specific IIA component
VTSVAELANIFNDPGAIPALTAASDVAEVQRIMAASEEGAAR